MKLSKTGLGIAIIVIDMSIQVIQALQEQQFIAPQYLGIALILGTALAAVGQVLRNDTRYLGIMKKK